MAYLANHATGAAYPAVSAKTFQDANLLIPPEPLLKKFGDATVPMVEEISILQDQSRVLRRTRDLLLPKLLSHESKLE